jgi:hypothetical protein
VSKEVQIGINLVALFKCEDEGCGVLFVDSVDCLFESPGPTIVACPNGHARVKFIQNIERIALLGPAEHIT